MAQFKTGTSGNPQGRPRQPKHDSASLRAKIGASLPAIIDTLTASALAGDVQACRTLLERCLPSLRPTTEPILLPGYGKGPDLITRAGEVLEAVAAGKIAPDIGLTLLNSLAKIRELSANGDGQGEDREFTITITDATRPPERESK